MIRHKKFFLTFTLCMLVACSHLLAWSAEYEKDLGDSKLSNKVRVAYSDAAERDLKKIRKVAVLLNSTSLLGGIAEDQLTLALRENGFTVVDRSKVSDLMRKEAFKEDLKRMEELLELEKQSGKEDSNLRDQKILEKRIEQLRKGKDNAERDITSLSDIGKLLGLDAVFTGTLFEGRRQIAFNEDKKPLSMDKPVVSTFHLQIIDIKTASVIAIIMAEYDKGESITDSVRVMTQYIKEITR